MEPDPIAPPTHATPLPAGVSVAAMRHRFRNQIQNMTSLVGLFGRRAATDECRRAFEDLRARFEAVTFVDDDGEAAEVEIDFAEFARDVIGHLDPDRKIALAVVGPTFRATPAHAAGLAQLVAEMLIDLRRNGFRDEAAGPAEVEIAPAFGGSLRIRVARTEPAPDAGPPPPDDLGLALAEGAVRNLGGTLTRSASGPLVSVAVIPSQADRS